MPTPQRSVPPQAHVSIIIPVFNKARYLEACLQSVREAVRAYGDAEVIAVDNGSTDGSREILGRWRDIHVIDLPGASIAAVRNRGARRARCEYLWFLDCDCVVPRDYLTRLMAVLSATQTDVTGCQVGLPHRPTWVEAVWHRMHVRPGDGDRNYINSGNLVISRQAFEAVGGFDESLVTGEDAEICQRLQDAGFRIFESKQLLVAHLDNAKTTAQFFRKEVWRGLGMFGTVRATSIDRPTAMLLVHLLFLATALAVLTGGAGTLAVRAATAVLLAIAVPALAVVYRALTSGSGYLPVRGIYLYKLYFLARAVALWHVARRRLASTARWAITTDASQSGQ